MALEQPSVRTTKVLLRHKTVKFSTLVGSVGMLCFAFLLASCGNKGTDGGVESAGVDAPLGLDEAGTALKQTRVEELVKACMKKAGFDYVPVDPNATKAAVTGTSGLTDDEFRRQFGYGISTVFEKVVEISQSSKSVDPNVTYRSRLDSAGQVAFDIALTGGKADTSVSGAVEAAKAGDLGGLGGCIEVGTTAVFGDANVISALAKIEELDSRAEADERLVKARANWSVCMRKQGFDYPEPNSVDGGITEKLAAIVGPDAAKVLGEDGTYSPLVFGTAALPPYDKAALARLQAEELATAEADLGCEEKFVVDIEDKVKAEYVKKFAQENAALLTKAQTQLERQK
jgi:hypothetical protein